MSGHSTTVGATTGLSPDSVDTKSQHHTHGDAKLPWESKEQWKKLGMGRKAWFEAGQPTEKTVQPMPGGTVIPKEFRRQRPARSKSLRSTTPEAQAIRDTIVEVFKTTGKVTFNSVHAACQAKGIESKSRNNLHYHINTAADLGVVPQSALDMQPRSRMSPVMLDHVIRLVTPQQSDGHTTIPKLTELLIAEGFLEKDRPKSAQQEFVRRYVNEGRKQGRIKNDWIVNGHRSEKREEIKALTPQIIAQNAPINVRGVFYKLQALNVVSKDRVTQEVARLSDILVEQREDGTIDADDIVDIRGTIHGLNKYKDPIEALALFAEVWYRRDLWPDVEDRVVIGIEKAGLRDVVRPVCDKFQVPLITPGGFGSYTLAKDTARLIDDNDGATYVYYFGDHDPSGLCIDDSFARRLNDLTDKNSRFEFERVGLQPKHIRQYGLATHPVNREDRRAKEFLALYGDECADLDALDPRVLRRWVETAIRKHLTEADITRAQHQEAWDRELMRQWIDQLKRSQR